MRHYTFYNTDFRAYYNIFEVSDYYHERSDPVNILNKYSDEIVLIKYKNKNVNVN